MSMIQLLLVIAVLGSKIATSTQYGYAPPLDPATYRSPDSRFSLLVNPSEPDGSGPATYTLSQGSTVKWTRMFPFTFQGARLSEAGRTLGFAYSEGRAGKGQLVIAIISDAGEVLLEDRHAREHSGIMHDDPVPRAESILPDPVSDQWLVSIERGSWLKYSVQQAKNLGPVTRVSGAEDANWVVSECPIPATPLVLVDWWHFGQGMGVVYTIHDRNGKKLWTLKMPNDYELGGSEDAQDALMTRMQQDGSILRSDQPNRFDLWFVKEAQRVSFQVTSVGGNWQVRELGRTAYAPPVRPKPVKPKDLVLPERHLAVVHRLVIPLEPPRSAIDLGQIDGFFTVGKDRFAILMDGRNLVLLDAKGTKIRSVDLGPIVRGDTQRVAASLGDARFVVITSTPGKNGSGRAQVVDLGSGAKRTLSAFKSDAVKAVAGLPNGRFAVLATENGRYTMTDKLALFDPAGKMLWRHGEAGYGGGNEELLSPEDLAITKAGHVVVLDNIRHTLQHFDQSGKLVKFVDLDIVWGKAPSYPVEVIETADGGYAMNDFGGEPPLYRLRSDGAIQSALRPHFSDGKALAQFDGPVQDPTGALWITDGGSLLRLDKDGMADRIVGATPSTSGLSAIEQLHVAADGTTYALDHNTAEVHVFAHTGVRKAIAKPLETDFTSRPAEYAALDVTRSGDVYVGGGTGEGELHFSPKGVRQGYVDFPSAFGDRPVTATGPISGDVKPQWRWRGSLLVDEKGNDIARLRRWPDQKWLLGGPSAVAPDGRLMAYGGPGDSRLGYSEAPDRIAFFTPGGMPEGLAALPKGLGDVYGSAFDGQMAYLTCGESIVAVNRSGKALWRFTPKGGCASTWPSLGCLAVFDGKKTVTWYKTD